MKRLILSLLFLCAAGAAAAQNYIVVNSEKIFKSQTDYNEALARIDEMGEQEQKNVDARFAQTEALYNNYMRIKHTLSDSARQAHEQQILQSEQEAQKYQEAVFGTEGTLMKKRIELIQPIQKRVFAAIESFAKAAGADLVLDSASNPTLLYCSEGVDKTQEIIDALK